MNKPNFSKIVRSIQTTITKHSPEILTGIGIAGMVTTTILAVKATPKALALLQEAEIEKVDNQVREGIAPDDISDKLTPVETVKATWKCYIPAAATGAASIACLIGASSVSLKRNAALATAYTLSETALKEYRSAVVETIGEKKEQIVRDKVAQDRIEKNPVSRNEVILTKKGDTLCYDHISGRYFKSDIDQIKRAINILNRQLLSEMYMSLNEFYDELGLDHIGIGDELGWNVEDGIIDPYFGSQIADGTPCIVLDYSVAPRRGFSHFA